MRTRISVVVFCLAVLAVGSAKAAFIVVDNFDSYGVGQDVLTNVVGSWTQGGGIAGSAVIVANPDGSGNVLSLANLSGANTSVYQSSGAITMPTGAISGTLFFQMRAKNDGLLHEGTAGMTDAAAPNSFSAGRGWTMFGNDGDGTATPGSGNSLGSYANDVTNTSGDPWGWSVGLHVTDDTWYNIWQVYHVDGNGVTGGTVDYYIQGGTEFPTQVMFRTGNLRGSTLAGALTTMVMLTDDASVSFFDNIYVDTTSTPNLANPVPEPATLALLAVGGAVLSVWRRRRA